MRTSPRGAPTFNVRSSSALLKMRPPRVLAWVVRPTVVNRLGKNVMDIYDAAPMAASVDLPKHVTRGDIDSRRGARKPTYPCDWWLRIALIMIRM